MKQKKRKLKDNLDLISLSDKSVEQQAVEQILRASCFLRQEIEEICGQFGLTKSQYFVLRILSAVQPGALARWEIIDKMIEPSPDVTRLIDKLEKEGLVERYRSEEDARMSMSRVTDKGLRLISDINTHIYKYFQSIGDSFTTADCYELIQLCQKMCPGDST